MARDQGARAQLALAFESTYGTAPGSGFRQIPFARESLAAAQPLVASELLGYGRDPLAPVQDVITVSGDVEVAIDAEAFGNWLKATFGAPTTTGTGPGPYTHVFSSAGWTLPSFALEKWLPGVPHSSMIAGAKVDRLAWSLGRSGNLTAVFGVLAQSDVPDTESNAGTPTKYALNRFGHFHGTISRNGSDIGSVVSAQVTYENHLDPIEVIRGDGLIEGLDPSMATLSGQLVTRFDGQTLLNQAIDGDACSLSFGYTRESGESLTFAVPRVFLPRPKVEVAGPRGIQTTFDWQAAQQTNGNPMCTVTLVNNTASY